MNLRRLQLLGKRDVIALRRWRWLILGASVLSIITLELLEHESITDPMFLREVALYGLAIPAIVWFILTLLADQADSRNDAEAKTGWYRELLLRLDTQQEWTELTRFIVSFPATFLPVDHVSLFVYDQDSAQLRFVTEWNTSGQAGEPPRSLPDASKPCAWVVSLMPGLHQGCTCPLMQGTTGGCAVRHFCLPLVVDNGLVGLIRVQCAPNQSLPHHQIQFLNSMASSIAMALALSIALPRQVIQAQRQERRRLAYELHDSLAQQMGYLHLTLDRLGGDPRMEDSVWLRGEFARLREVAGDSYLQIRESLDRLEQQDATDLTQTIADYLHRMRQRVPFKIEFQVVGVPLPLGPLATQHVFGLIQESLNNIQKYAQARQAGVDMRWSDRWLEITVTDDGVGFEVIAVPAVKHYGLRMLRERTLELHGEMQIESIIGSGTSLQFRIPLLLA